MRKVYYDKKKIYKTRIAPLIKELKLICFTEKIPMFVSVAVKNSPDGTEYKNDMVLATTNVHLTDNRIADCLLALNGFEEEPPGYIKDAIRNIEEYLEKIKVTDEDTAGIDELEPDHISSFHRILNGGDAVRVQREYFSGAVNTDFEDD